MATESSDLRRLYFCNAKYALAFYEAGCIGFLWEQRWISQNRYIKRSGVEVVILKLSDLTQGMEIPPTLQVSVQRYQANLACLVGNLHVAGLSAGQIEESINMLVETYRAELASVLRVDQHWP